jgi:hypothetical protein
MAKPLTQAQVDNIFLLYSKGLNYEEIGNIMSIAKERVKLRLRGITPRIVKEKVKPTPEPDRDFTWNFETNGFFDEHKWAKHLNF